MNRTLSVKALLTALLVIGLLASTALTVIYYQKEHASEVQVRALSGSLNDTKNQLDKTRSQLDHALAQLKQTTGQLSEAQAESQRRLSLVFAQEDNVNVLKSCLTGVVADDMYFRKGSDALFTWVDSKSDDDLETALDNFRSGRGALDSVSDDCGKASSLFAGS